MPTILPARYAKNSRLLAWLRLPAAGFHRLPFDQLRAVSPSNREAAATRAALSDAPAEQILDNALISAGMLEDATPMVARLYKLLESV